eukprot:COSAG01_NODE_21881_length_881_cov_0.985934_1_plen_47_part_10
MTPWCQLSGAFQLSGAWQLSGACQLSGGLGGSGVQAGRQGGTHPLRS